MTIRTKGTARIAFDVPQEIRDWLYERARREDRSLTREVIRIFVQVMKEERQCNQQKAA